MLQWLNGFVYGETIICALFSALNKRLGTESNVSFTVLKSHTFVCRYNFFTYRCGLLPEVLPVWGHYLQVFLGGRLSLEVQRCDGTDLKDCRHSPQKAPPKEQETADSESVAYTFDMLWCSNTDCVNSRFPFWASATALFWLMYKGSKSLKKEKKKKDIGKKKNNLQVSGFYWVTIAQQWGPNNDNATHKRRAKWSSNQCGKKLSSKVVSSFYNDAWKIDNRQYLKKCYKYCSSSSQLLWAREHQDTFINQ